MNTEILKIIRNKIIKTNIFRIQSNKFTIYGYFCIGFIGFMLAGKTLIVDTSLFSIYDISSLFPKRVKQLIYIQT